MTQGHTKMKDHQKLDYSYSVCIFVIAKIDLPSVFG